MRVLTSVALIVAGCSERAPPPIDDAAVAGWTLEVALPEPIANNAVAAIAGSDGCTLVTAAGIDGSLAAGGIHPRAWSLAPSATAWTALPDLPGVPRIAASAVTLRGRVYVVGGYSVAAGGSETTHGVVFALDPAAGWTTVAPLPVPIDDAVAVAWRDRWLVVVSGWSNSAPVAAVQIYDLDSETWAMATPFPGTPVFGHAGAIVGDDLVIVDGVAASGGGFAAVEQTWRGVLDPDHSTQIAWTSLGDHPGPARYRAAAGAIGGRMVFHGGTDTPYNFDGRRYDNGSPALPLATAFAFDPLSAMFADDLPIQAPATMDHRGLVGCGEVGYTIGGIAAGPMTSSQVSSLRL